MTVMYGPSLVVLVAILVGHCIAPAAVALNEATASSLAGALGLFAGVMFGVSLTVLDKAVDMDLMGVPPGPTTERAAKRLQALAANTLFVAMLAGVATGLLILGALAPAVAEVATAIAVAAMVLVGTNSVLIAGRVFSEAKWRTDRVRTGESMRANRREGPFDDGVTEHTDT